MTQIQVFSKNKKETNYLSFICNSFIHLKNISKTLVSTKSRNICQTPKMEQFVIIVKTITTVSQRDKAGLLDPPLPGMTLLDIIFLSKVSCCWIQLMKWIQLKHCHCVSRSFSGPYFPAFRLNTERYSVSVHIQSKCGRIRTRKTPKTPAYLSLLCWREGLGLLV